MIRTQIQLKESQMQALRSVSTARKLSMSELIRQAVDMLLQNSVTPDPDERKRRAIALAGRFRSDVSDLSTEHDRYLGEDYAK